MVVDQSMPQRSTAFNFFHSILQKKRAFCDTRILSRAVVGLSLPLNALVACMVEKVLNPLCHALILL